MKRQCVEDAGAPDYPTFRDFRKNRRDFLKSFGMGVAGLTLASCESREPPRIVGSLPPPETPVKGGDTKVPRDVSPPGTPPPTPGVPLPPKHGGAIAVPTPPQ